MSEVEEVRQQIETHQAALRKIEADLRNAITERAELEPSGLFAMFSSSPDPRRLDEVNTEIEILKQEMLHRRQQLQQARERQEALEREAQKNACVPPWVQDASSAARVLKAIGELSPLLVQLRSMATAASMGRASQRRMTGVGRRSRALSAQMQTSRMADATAASTAQWEPVLDQAELLADRIGMKLVLPRRYSSAARPEHAPQPDPGIAAAREAARCSSDLEFGPALETVVPRITQAQTHCTYARAAITERFPEASALATTLPESYLYQPDATPASAPDTGDEGFVELWEEQRALFGKLAALVAHQASTLQLLDPMRSWQRQAAAVRAHPLATELDLRPPVNDGAALSDFLAGLLEEWPALDERFETWRLSHAG